MKSQTTIAALVICAVALFAAFEYSQAAPQATATSRIGIVSVRNAFNASKKHAQYRAQVLASQSQARAGLETLSKQADAEEAGLKTLKPGTTDYLTQLQSVLEKRARLQTQQEYLKQERTLQDKMWMEKLYQEILKVTKEIAQEKGLELVLEQTEPEFPISSEELMVTFSSHKVLYGGGCVDLTEEVTARLDASDNLKP
jgi:Skp family chaperone for outer membrane proteins